MTPVCVVQATRQDVGNAEGAAAPRAAPDEGCAGGDRDGDSSSHHDGGFLNERSARHVFISRMIQRAATSCSAGACTLEGIGSGGEEAQGSDKAARPGQEAGGAKAAGRPLDEAAAAIPAAAETPQPSAAGARDVAVGAVTVKQEGVALVPVSARAAGGEAEASDAQQARLAAGMAAGGRVASGAGEGPRAEGSEAGAAAACAPQGGLNTASLSQFLSGSGAAQAGMWQAGVAQQQAQMEVVQAALKQNLNQQVQTPSASQIHLFRMRSACCLAGVNRVGPGVREFPHPCSCMCCSAGRAAADCRRGPSAAPPGAGWAASRGAGSRRRQRGAGGGGGRSDGRGRTAERAGPADPASAAAAAAAAAAAVPGSGADAGAHGAAAARGRCPGLWHSFRHGARRRVSDERRPARLHPSTRRLF